MRQKNNCILYRFTPHWIVMILIINFTHSFAEICFIQNEQPLKDSTTFNFNSIRDITYFYEPFPMKTGNSIIQIGGSFSLLPIPVIENEFPIPAIDVQYKYGLSKNISVAANFSTNFFSNLLHAGLQWNINSDQFSFGMANHIGGAGGFITAEGQFDNVSAYALYFMPILRFGYRFDDFSFSTSWVVTYIFKSENNVSGLKARGPEGTWNDYYCTLAIEQPFLKHNLISIGFSLAYSRTPYQAWMLHNTIEQYFYIPEFFFALQL